MRAIAPRIFTMENEQDLKDIESVHSFIVTDIAGTLSAMKKKAKIIEINYLEGSTEEKKEQIKFILDTISADIPCVFCASSYVSTSEFPPNEYYLDDPEEGKKPVPVEEILQRENKFLEELGFININDYTQYNYKVAYIYGNDIGKEIREFLTKMILKNEE